MFTSRSLIPVVFLSLLLTSGCADPENSSSSTSTTTSTDPGTNPESNSEGSSGETKGTIAYTTMSLTNPFFKVIGDAMTEEAAKHGYDTIIVSGDDDVSKQAISHLVAELAHPPEAPTGIGSPALTLIADGDALRIAE